ncbi:MAG: hypothetical protein G01um10148_768 [Parcubacteria group bacterium Gr01-1014_8]|nr:MAG: hypothetical protein G01um10148_768 [Parcubacteria group bacterium Gr01-1014_8]
MSEPRGILPEHPPELSASLSHGEFLQLMAQANRKKFGLVSIDKRIDAPGFPKQTVTCTWMYSYMHSKEPSEITVLLDHEKQNIAAFQFIAGPDQRSGRIWRREHSFVREKKRGSNESIRGQGIGSYALRTAEDFIAALCIHDPRTPTVIEFSSSRPSVIQFAHKNGYEFVSTAHKKVFDEYLDEWKAHRESEHTQNEENSPLFSL